MNIKLIACEALTREFRLAAATTPHVVDIKFIAFGLHNTPDELRRTIQAEVDESEGKGYDAIVLGYGLCSRGTAEIRARSVPIIIPRAHDCITLFLGSRNRYSREFSEHPGTYYFSPGWIERKEGEMEQGQFTDTKAQDYETRYREYVEKYGEDNAKFLIEQEKQWHANYTRAAFINMGLGDIAAYRQFTQDLAADRGWSYAEMEGDMSLVNALMSGDWENEDFLRVDPGKSVLESFDEFILKSS